ncbi:hypothetical protein ACIGO7_35410 [Streptomyces virginiae]|uniref:hypothetical protein n=1 Tax=Streptomyces virginiae TaxID=1961 RepID=UPI00344F8463
MDVSGYKLHTDYQACLDRIEAVADQAAHLVERKMREDLGPARVIVSDGFGTEDFVRRHEQQLIGARRPARLTDSEPFGRTTIDSRGVLVLVNAEACGMTKELDITLVHELVHAVQLSRPEGRQLALQRIRNNHKTDRLSWSAAFTANRRVAADEREARRYEHLARKLR